jgi:exodeoxyribonuclease VII large subunit
MRPKESKEQTVQDYITVGALNAYICRLLESDSILQNFWLKGEISGMRLYQQSGHLYFTLKDKDAAISCVMFKSKVHNLKFKPEDGMEVLLRGYVSVFARQGRYQVYVDEMQPFGVGGLYLYLEKLKERLASQGYFSSENKKALPRTVNRVGVITSQDGAALRDILRVIKQRDPRVEVIIVHSSVQGAEAPKELARGVELMNQYGQVDLIIIGRGGGSMEDLMAFNSEELVYSIFNSQIPVISGVGHEVDFCLCDLVADLRAATPTQAAQFAVAEFSMLEKNLQNLNDRLKRVITKIISNRAERLDLARMKRVWKEPGFFITRQETVLQDKRKRLVRAIQDKLKDDGHRLAMAIQGLDNMSPLKVMARGYAILTQGERVIMDINDVQIGEELQATLINGRLKLLIKGKEKGNYGEYRKL